MAHRQKIDARMDFKLVGHGREPHARKMEIGTAEVTIELATWLNGGGTCSSSRGGESGSDVAS